MRDYLNSSSNENQTRTDAGATVCTDIPSSNADMQKNILCEKDTEMERRLYNTHVAGKVNEKKKKYGFLLKRSVNKINENICQEDENEIFNGITDSRIMRTFEKLEMEETLENTKEGEKAEKRVNTPNLQNKSQNIAIKTSEDKSTNSELFLIHRSVFNLCHLLLSLISTVFIFLSSSLLPQYGVLFINFSFITCLLISFVLIYFFTIIFIYLF